MREGIVLKTIGVISDTHGSLDKDILEFLAPVDQVWHAGDFGGGTEVYSRLATLKDLVGVYGNVDGYDLRDYCPRYQFFECEGKKVLMTHIGGFPGRYDPEARQKIHVYKPDIFVCGHSHILRVMNDTYYNMLVINPGAAGHQGFHLVRTALRFKIDAGELSDMEVYEAPK